MPLPPAVLTACLTHVRHVAKQMLRRVPAWVTIDDLVGAGNLGLAEAIRASERRSVPPVEFAAYASVRIRGAMLDALRALDPMAHELRLEWRHIDKVRRRLTDETGVPPHDEALAEGWQQG